MLKIGLADFYITHHCNLNCDACNRFNNYRFRGHMDWRTHELEYQKWSQRAAIRLINILGGEPLMHPDVLGWMQKLREWWPRAQMSMMTNGTLMDRVPGLYDVARQTGCVIEICVHNTAWHPDMLERLDRFFPKGYDLTTNENDRVFYQKIAQDTNGVRVKIKRSTRMYPSAMTLEHGGLHLHNSDPQQAHHVCSMSSCHHFIDGRIYKCGMPPLIKAFGDQYRLAVGPDEQAIIDDAGGFTADQALEDPSALIDYLRNPIDHCRFCPETYVYRDVQAQVGKKSIPIELRR